MALCWLRMYKSPQFTVLFIPAKCFYTYQDSPCFLWQRCLITSYLITSKFKNYYTGVTTRANDRRELTTCFSVINEFLVILAVVEMATTITTEADKPGMGNDVQRSWPLCTPSCCKRARYVRFARSSVIHWTHPVHTARIVIAAPVLAYCKLYDNCNCKIGTHLNQKNWSTLRHLFSQHQCTVKWIITVTVIEGGLPKLDLNGSCKWLIVITIRFFYL